MLGVVRIHVDSWKHYEASMNRLFNRVIAQGAKSRKKKPSGKDSRRTRVNQMLHHLELEAALSDVGTMSVVKPATTRSIMASSSVINYISDAAASLNEDNDDLASTVTGATSRISGSSWAHSDIDRLLAQGSKHFDSGYLGLMEEQDNEFLSQNEDQFCPTLASLALDTLNPQEDRSTATTPIRSLVEESVVVDDEQLTCEPLALASIEEATVEDHVEEEDIENQENINTTKRRHKMKTLQKDVVVTQSQGTVLKQMSKAPWNHPYRIKNNIRLYQYSSEYRWLDNFRSEYELVELNSTVSYDGGSLIRFLGTSYIGEVTRLSGWLERHASEYEEFITEFTDADIEKIRGRTIAQYPTDAVTPVREDRKAYRGVLADDDHMSEKLTNLSVSESRRNDSEYPSRDLSAPDKRRGIDVDVPARPLDPEQSLLDRESDIEQSDSGLTPSSRSVATSLMGSEIDAEEVVDDLLNPSDLESLPEPDDQEIAMRSFTMTTFRVKRRIEGLLLKRGNQPLYFHEIAKSGPSQKAPLFWQLLTLVTSGDLNIVQESAYGPIKIIAGSMADIVQDNDYTQRYGGPSYTSDPSARE